MACLSPMELSKVDLGCVTDLVCYVKVFDPNQTAHLLISRADGVAFLFDGMLDDGFTSFTLFNVTLEKFYPVPLVVASKDSTVMGHHKLSWDSLHSVVDLCAGFGGLSQGAEAGGFDITVAIDQNQLMLELHGKMHDAHRICGDIGDRSVVHEAWRHSRGAAVVSSGFSCQPFSSLGDGRSSQDSRASCLTKTLNAAYYLNSALVVLECVAPAAHDSFVQAELERFCKITGYHLTQTELKLDHAWPCRRHRSWWVLSSPELGRIPIHSWPVFTNVCEVQQIIPEIRLWDSSDEKLLALDDIELAAFGVNNNTHARYLLNGKATAPCALHAWGSQTRPCPCGCRKMGFSCQRLESKGLHGCIVRSAILPDGTTNLRHLHPNEVMGLNTVDPIIDLGTNVRLSLSAVGQLACPLQSLCIFGFIAAHLDAMRLSPVFTAEAQIQALRSWLLMRCRQVWPVSCDPIQDPKLLSMMQFWHEVKDLSIRELLFPLRWEGKIEGGVNIASVLDHLIRVREVIPPTVQEQHEHDDIATPWLDSPAIVDDTSTVGCMMADSCTVVFESSDDSPIRFQPNTVAQFLQAHEKLVGSFQVSKISLNGRNIGYDHVMEVGQVIVIALASPLPAAGLPSEPAIVISPTAEWTQPAQDPIEDSSPPRKVSKFDVGQCSLPSHDFVDQPWLDATPFLSLQGDQFLKLVVPSITTVQQLWSVRHQFFRKEDRLQILQAQGNLMADDEIRFHLHGLKIVHRDHLIKAASHMTQVCVIDPLLATAWISGKGFDCKLWAQDHPDIKAKGSLVITALLINHHWIPVFMSPVKDVLQVFTWDGATACHDGLTNMVQTLAVGLGFTNALMCREHRLFFSSDLCGALAIVFLRHALVGTLLPTDGHEATLVHSKLRERFVQVLQNCQITDRPWIWGAGPADFTPADSPANALATVINITRDERIDLINSNGFAMADDEIRFHLVNLVQNQTVQSTLLGRTFVFFEPLVFSCWDSIGRTITEQWCISNLEVRTQGKSIVTAFSVDGHWVPLWFSPRGNMLQVHTFQSSVDLVKVEEVLEVISDFLDFRAYSIHRVPDSLPNHMMCGAQAMAFIAHVIMNMPLPETLQELRTLHTNMRASFVAHLYSVGVTPRPVVWGNGPREFGPLHDKPGGAPEPSDDTVVPNSGNFSGGAAHSWEVPVSPVPVPAGESGPLPIMPVEGVSVGQGIGGLSSPADACNSHVSHDAQAAHSVQSACQRNERLHQITSHSYAMADDEVQFQLEHLASCQNEHNARQFIVLPPAMVIKWIAGDDNDLHQWIQEHRHQFGHEGFHVFTVILLEQHWIPVWFAPCFGGVTAHTLADFASDEAAVDRTLHLLVHKCGSALRVIHRVPHGLPIERLCGAMSICFLAQIILGTRMPSSIEEVYARCWSMKELFAEAIQNGLVTEATYWGWGFDRESRQLPIMPEWSPFVARMQSMYQFPHEFLCLHVPSQVYEDVPFGMTSHEMAYHLARLSAVGPWSCLTFSSLTELASCVRLFALGACDTLAGALLVDSHWSPVLAWQDQCGGVIVVEGDGVADFLSAQFPALRVCSVPLNTADFCGAATWYVIAQVVGVSVMPCDLRQLRDWLLQDCPEGLGCDDPCIGYGPHGQLLKSLAAELSKHGVPAGAVDDRARAAIKALGSEQLLEALNHRQPWRQLKILGNNSKFQFVLPSELASAVEANKGKPVSTKGKGKGKSKNIHQGADLDPSKLVVLEGMFKSHDRVLSQLTMKQIGPLSSGVILMAHTDAEPYLKAGRMVSQEPLALLVLQSAGYCQQ